MSCVETEVIVINATSAVIPRSNPNIACGGGAEKYFEDSIEGTA